MIALAASLLLCSWLWFTGATVPRSPATATWLCGAALVCLWSAYARAGRRLPWKTRAARAAGWAAAAGALVIVLAAASSPLVDQLAPLLSSGSGPSRLVAAVGRGAGLDAWAFEGKVAVEDLVANRAHATSWQQLEIPAALALWTILCLANACRVRGRGRFALLSVLVITAWVPFRFLLASRLAVDVGWISSLWHPVAVAASFWPAAWLCGALSPLRSLSRLPWPPRPRPALRWALGAAGVALCVAGMTIVAPGTPSQRRILMDDAHSDWEWTTIPFDKTHYGRQSTYSYVSFADFLAHHYPRVATHLQGDLTPQLLADYDVLILKTPTRPYLESERDAVTQFVARGGGLLLISDHTNLFGMTTYINPIGEPFGIQFMADDTFDVNTGNPSFWVPPVLARHAAVASMPPLTFETSCSIRPAPGLRSVISGRALGSEAADYSHVNFFGNMQADPEDHWGVFLQAAAVSYGRGRVVAFSDSTVFSNFSVFFRGKPELALGMLEFVARSEGTGRILLRLMAAAGLGLCLLAAAPAMRARLFGPAMLGAVSAGIILGGLISSWTNTRAHPLPAVEHPMTVVGFDRVHSDYRLPTILEVTTPDADRCFDAFFVATQRIHLFPRVEESLRDDAPPARVRVMLNPTSLVSEEDRREVYAWVEGGGSLLIMDPERGPHVAANRILEPAGMRISAAFPGSPGVHSAGGMEIAGGESVVLKAWNAPGTGAHADETAGAAPAPPLIAEKQVGRGRVVALLGSEKFSGSSMGPVFTDPTPRQRMLYASVYELFEAVLIPEGWPQSCRLVQRLGADALPGREGETVQGHGSAP